MCQNISVLIGSERLELLEMIYNELSTCDGVSALSHAWCFRVGMACRMAGFSPRGRDLRQHP